MENTLFRSYDAWSKHDETDSGKGNYGRALNTVVTSNKLDTDTKYGTVQALNMVGYSLHRVRSLIIMRSQNKYGTGIEHGRIT